MEKRLLNEKQQYTSLTSLSPVYMVFDNTMPITLTSVVPSGGGRYYLGRGGGGGRSAFDELFIGTRPPPCLIECMWTLSSKNKNRRKKKKKAKKEKKKKKKEKKKGAKD